MKYTAEEVRERVARAICAGCEENPDHLGDARGNDYRWQDYLDVADAVIDAHLAGMGEPVAQGESAWLERLKDPATVHALMLRGVIAIPSIRSMVDLRGEVPNGEEVQLLRIAELQEQLAAQPRAVPDGITALINAHAELLESNPYCYFELAYTRQTEWMAWLCSKPAEDDPDRKILACGQGNTPNEACMQALGMLAAAPSPGESNTTNQQAAR